MSFFNELIDIAHYILVERTVLVLALLCIPVSGVFLWLQREKLKLDKWWKLILAPIIYVLVGLASLAVFSIVHDIRSFPKWSIHHQGMLFVFPLFFPLAAKVIKADWREVSDALSVSLPGIIAILRIFCLVRGCCYGEYIFGTSLRWPVREGAILLNLACCVVFVIWNSRKHLNGILLPVYMLFYSAYRIVELLLKSDKFCVTNNEDYLFVFLSAIVATLVLIIIDEVNKKRFIKKR